MAELGQSLILANARYRLFIQVTLPNKYCSSAMAAEPTTSTQSLSDKLLHRVQQQQQNCHPQGAACFLADTVRCCPGYTCLRGGGQTQGTGVLRVHKAVFLRAPLGFQPLVHPVPTPATGSRTQCRDQLEGKIQERYGLAKDQIRKDIDDWYKSQKELTS